MSSPYPNSNTNVNTVVTISEEQSKILLGAVMRRVYLWMFLGLLVTAILALYVAGSGLIVPIMRVQWVFPVLLFAELGLVMVVSLGLNRLSVSKALVIFFVYAALNGVTLSVIFLVYQLGTIGLTFFATACLFGALSIIGYTTKTDLTRAGNFLFVGLLGLVIASVINIFFANSTLDWLITYAGIAIFLGLTIYDTQKIKQLMAAALAAGPATQGVMQGVTPGMQGMAPGMQSMSLGIRGINQDEIIGRIGVIGALRLYLDFINLFLMLLRLTGRRR